jgi:hypothetical protein
MIRQPHEHSHTLSKLEVTNLPQTHDVTYEPDIISGFITFSICLIARIVDAVVRNLFISLVSGILC